MNAVWLKPCWVWQPETAGYGDWAYRLFNLFEGLAWLVFGVLVIHRWYRHRRSPWEWSYALAFVAFGITDFCEAYSQWLGLLLIKGVVLIWLMRTRERAIHVWYPGSSVF